MTRRTRDKVIEAKVKGEVLNEKAKLSYIGGGEDGTIKTTAFIKPANANQRALVKSINNNDISIVIGPAGTGKTLVSLFTGVKLLNSPDSPIKKIVYVRACVHPKEESEIIGILPGSFLEKVKPLAYPVLDNLINFVTDSTATYLIDSGKIEVMPLSMMRGRSFSNSYIIIDELQNCSPSAVKTILSRLGMGSKMVLCGDPYQSDVFKGDPTRTGIYDAVQRLGQLEDRELDGGSIGIVKLSREDIVRHGLVSYILDLYDDVN